MINAFSIFVIFFSGCMSWTLSMGQLMERNRQTFHYMFSLFLFSLGVFQFYNAMNVSGLIYQHTWLAFMHLPFLTMTGPTIFFCSKSVLHKDFSLTPRDALHFLPILMITILLLPLFMLDPGTKKIILSIPPDFNSGNPFVSYYQGVIVVVIIIILSYMFIYVKETLNIFKLRFIQQKKVSMLFTYTMMLTYSVVFIYLSGLLITNLSGNGMSYYRIVLQSISIAFFIVVLFIQIMAQREMNYFQTIKDHTEKIRYEQSKIRKLNIDTILVQLLNLMEKEKIFCDEDISLTNLSRELGIESYQLSQIINENFKKNFNTFINEFRIGEAKKILIDDINRTIVSVSYAVGFNSPASFYEWFLKFTGVSPAKYRKNALRESERMP